MHCGACFPARGGCGCILVLLLVAAVVLSPSFTWVFPLGGRSIVELRSKSRWTTMTRVLVVDNYDSFVYTLNGYLAGARRRDRGGAQRRHRGRRRAARASREYDARADLARARHARGRRGVDPGRERGARAGPAAARRLPRPPGDRRGVRRDRHATPRSSCTARPRCITHDDSDFYDGRAAAVHGDPLPLARGRRRHGAAPSSWSRAAPQGGVIMGLAHQYARRSTACSSTPSRCSPRAATACSATGSRSPGCRRRASARCT